MIFPMRHTEFRVEDAVGVDIPTADPAVSSEDDRGSSDPDNPHSWRPPRKKLVMTNVSLHRNMNRKPG